ncbi:MAG TPA: pyridoxal phosphate-dependent aminotransferase [Planctomycetota bacterium]|nr:pyridoxal phosphate-dependent aminotransferase [Planctomycetota bacterium]
MKYAGRMQRLGTETAFEVLARAKRLEAEGRSIVHLEIGQPDFPTPPHVVEAAVAALRDGHTGYTPAPGLVEIREAVAEHVAARLGQPVHPDEVVVTPGGKPIMFYAFLAFVEPGDEVVYPNPGFPIYESMLDFTGARRVPMPLAAGEDFRIDVDALAGVVTDRTRLLILNTPGNPTGAVVAPEDLPRIAEIVRRHPDLVVLSDEIYSRILYEGRHASIVAQPGMRERSILLDGFSKAYSMTGWRLGYGVMPRDVAARFSQLMVNSNSCTANFVQRAGVAALRGPQDSVDAMVAEFRRRRDLIVDGLNSVPGFRARRPGGAFYAFPRTDGTGLASSELANRLLMDAGVACLSGTCFGGRGEGFLRFSFANSAENLREGIARIRRCLESAPAAARG